MCLYADKEATLALHAKMKKSKTGRIKAWKIVRRGENNEHRAHSAERHNHVYPWFYSAGIPFHTGTILSTSRRTKLPCLREGREVGPGHHVYLKHPIDHLGFEIHGDCGVLAVWCHIDDLIAVDWYRAAAFTKITVTKRALARAEREANCRE